MPNLWDAFNTQVESAPDAPALVFGDAVTTFAELHDMAERCASALAARGICKGHVVGLHLPKRATTYALLLGCLRLGAPYVFLDPKNPPDRLERIFNRVSPAIVFSMTGVSGAPCDVVTLTDGDEMSWANAGGDTIAVARDEVAGTDPAYIMFTSGSTGEPKGAVIPHQGVLSLIGWARQSVLTESDERLTAINPLHFDNSVFDTYCSLFNGAALVPVETGEIASPIGWLRAIRSGAATVMFAVPTLFLILDDLKLLDPESLPSVRTFVFGGEGFPIGRLRSFFERFEGTARLINVYGPTETSCICSSVPVTAEILAAPDHEFPPLGRMHRDFTHAVLDDECLPVEKGSAGELWIGGPCVGLGYYNNADETEKRFRQDPRQDAFRSIFYRTGDLVREDAAGQLWFQGRADNQVKVRGYRIELEEIDLAVQAMPGVRRALAVVVSSDDDKEIGVAFAADREIAHDDLRQWCSTRLPHYMQPSRLVQMDALPLNANGKADRRAAAKLFEEAMAET